jgi:hypothetical protein
LSASLAILFDVSSEYRFYQHLTDRGERQSNVASGKVHPQYGGAGAVDEQQQGVFVMIKKRKKKRSGKIYETRNTKVR